MPNLVNESITAEYSELLSSELDALFVQPVGMSVEDVNAFRTQLGEANLRMRLLKGSLARRALEAADFDAVGGLFDGPAAIITEEPGTEVEGPAIAASRVVAAWRKSGHELPAVKGGVMDGEVLDAQAARKLASLPTKADMQARLVAQILSPAARLSGQMIAGGGKIAGAIKTHIEKLEQND